MVDAETKNFLAKARGRRQVEISARLVAAGAAGSDPRAAERQAALWTDARARILEAVGRHGGQGLRVLRAEKTRPGLILTGTALAWRAFFEREAALAADGRLEFRHYVRPWSFGLPNFPE